MHSRRQRQIPLPITLRFRVNPPWLIPVGNRPPPGHAVRSQPQRPHHPCAPNLHPLMRVCKVYHWICTPVRISCRCPCLRTTIFSCWLPRHAFMPRSTTPSILSTVIWPLCRKMACINARVSHRMFHRPVCSRALWENSIEKCMSLNRVQEQSIPLCLPARCVVPRGHDRLAL